MKKNTSCLNELFLPMKAMLCLALLVQMSFYITIMKIINSTTQISESTMGSKALSQDKKKMVISDESGAVRLIDVKSAKVEKTFSSEHVDNIYSVAYSKGTIITAGQDRRVGIYRENKDPYHIKSNFLVYSVGLSPSSETGVYSSGHDHHLQLFNTKDGSRTDSLVGHYATPTKSCLFMKMRLSLRGTKKRSFFGELIHKQINNLFIILLNKLKSKKNKL